jgi:hypothetical protein
MTKIFILVFFSIRLIAGLLLMAITMISPEGAQIVIADLPTILIYFLISRFGIHMAISGPFDLLFSLIGLATWALLGWVTGRAVILLRKRNDSKAQA